MTGFVKITENIMSARRTALAKAVARSRRALLAPRYHISLGLAWSGAGVVSASRG